MEWKDYEKQVLEYFKMRHTDGVFKTNIKLPGKLSKTPREIDILIEIYISEFTLRIAIECKSWKSKLDVADVGSYIDKLKDVGISKGIMISKFGYSEGAHARAKSESELQLQVLNFENINSYIGFWGNPYRGNVGAIIPAPTGWVINSNIPENWLPDMLCLIHPFEFNIHESINRKSFMYFQISPFEKIDLKLRLQEQDKVVLQKDPESKIEYWEEEINEKKYLFRKISCKKKGISELTCGIEMDNFFSYCVYSLPDNYTLDDISRLRFIMKEACFIKMLGIDPNNSHEIWKRALPFFS